DQEKILQNAKIATDGASLIAYLKKQTLDDVKRAEIKALIHKLGDSSFEVREKAREDLVAQGDAAAPLLSQVAKDPDPEISSRAKDCRETIGKAPAVSFMTAAMRLRAHRT